MIVPRAILDFGRRHHQHSSRPFLYGPRSKNDWPIQAIDAGGFYLLFLDPCMAKRLYGNGDVHNCAGALVAALGDLTPLPFENSEGKELGTLCTVDGPDIGDVLAVFGDGALFYLSWFLRTEKAGFYLRLIDADGGET